MNIKAIAEKIGMDYEGVLEDFCGDVSAVRTKLQAFASSETAALLAASVASSDFDTAKKLAHRLRKDAEKLGLSELAEKAGRLEEVSPEKLVTDWPEVEELCTAITEAIGGKAE